MDSEMLYHNNTNPNPPKSDVWWNCRVVKMGKKTDVLPVLYVDGKPQPITDDSFDNKLTDEILTEAFFSDPLEISA